MQCFRQQKAMSLMELLLVLVAVAVILLLVMRYYVVTRQSAKVSEATQQINQIVQAGYRYMSGGGVTSENISLQVLVDGNFLPQKFAVMKNPWKGAISIANAQGALANQNFAIIYENVPKASCEQLAAYFESKASVVNNASSAVCTESKKGGYDFSGTF